MTRSVRATFTPARASEYRSTAGAWTLAGSLDSLLTAASARAGSNVLVADDAGERLGAAQLADAVAHVAGALHDRGVRTGDAVAWQLPNCAGVATLYRACWRLGAIAVPLHHNAGPAEVERMVAAVDVRLKIARPGLPLFDVEGALRPEDLDTKAPITDVFDDESTLAAVLFTAGSTGTPKAVLHSHATLAYKAATMVREHGLTEADVVLMPAPAAHISGLLNGVTLPGAVPCKAVFMARWNPEAALTLIERERVSYMVGPPTFFVSLLRSPEFTARRVESLRLISCGGAGVSDAFVEEASAALGAVVKRTYGSTEAPTVATSRPVARARDRAHRHDPLAIGEAELEVHDPASGLRCAPGSAGELWVRGPEVCLGYLDAGATAMAFTTDGWFRTGDIATIDEAGNLAVTGRLRDVIIRGGENIAVTEIELVLAAHPDVHDAVVVGRPDELMGERVHAVVVADASFDLAACREWFAAQGVARFKIPESLEHVAALPLLPTGKPDRARLRARAAAG